MPITYIDEPKKSKITYIDEPSAVKEPQRERTTAEYILPAAMTAYQEKPGERTLLGDIFERPGAAVRSALQGKGYAQGALLPEKVRPFQDIALEKYYDKVGTGIPQQIGGLGVSAAGVAADMATNPADVLTLLAPSMPGAQAISKAIGSTEPMQALGRFATKERHIFKTRPKIEKESVDIYRQILRPTQGEVKTVEVRGRKNIDDAFTIAAEEKLPIGVAKEGDVSKLDTARAREQVMSKIDDLDTQLTKKLTATKGTQPYFDLTQVKAEAKRQARASTSNDTVYKQLSADIDEYIKDAIKARAKIVSGSELNEIKRGMYSVGYNQSKPTSDKSARFIAKAAKSKIEKAYPGDNIKQINDIMGRYLTLNKLLEGAHGRVVSGGRMENMSLRA